MGLSADESMRMEGAPIIIICALQLLLPSGNTLPCTITIQVDITDPAKKTKFDQMVHYATQGFHGTAPLPPLGNQSFVFLRRRGDMTATTATTTYHGFH